MQWLIWFSYRSYAAAAPTVIFAVITSATGWHGNVLMNVC